MIAAPTAGPVMKPNCPVDATPFDIAGAELSDHDGRCSFESFLGRYDLRDPGLERIARIVHEADLEDERFDAPEAAGVDAIVRGLGRLHGDDEVLELSAPIFDALYTG